ncbi:MAG: cobalamin-binding protein [Candidatus Rokubacteria bacterium]|nr:cobalamin-binding protein [Candidatus Rokubacteria bacterium]
MSAPAAPVDASGAPWPDGAPPRRIVSLVPSVTETLCALGLGEALVGVTVYCVEPAAIVRGKTKIGGEKNPDLEKIRSLVPDLVVANVEENLREHVDALRAWGIPVWVTYPRTVAEGITMIRELGAVTGTAARAAAIADPLEALLARVEAAGRARRPARVFYPIWLGPYMTISADTYVHDMLRACGAANVFGDRPERYPTVTLPEVAAAAPEVIVLPDEPFRFRRVHARDFDPWPALPAVRDGRIHFVDGKLFCWYGPRIADALARLPALFASARGG